MNYSLCNLDQLTHQADIEDNKLAQAICDKVEEAIEQAVEKATSVNDDEYSYTIHDAVETIEFLLHEAEWQRKETRQSDKVVYMIEGFRSEYHRNNNQLTLWRHTGGSVWYLEWCAGEYGEDEGKVKVYDGQGFKKAQEAAVKALIAIIRDGAEINCPY